MHWVIEVTDEDLEELHLLVHREPCPACGEMSDELAKKIDSVWIDMTVYDEPTYDKEGRMVSKNEERVERGEAVLREYLRRTGDPVQPDGTNVVDVVADVLHHAHRRGFDIEAISRMAVMHVQEEQVE